MSISIFIWWVAVMLFYGYRFLITRFYDVSLFELIYYTIMPLKGGNKGPFIKELPKTISFAVAGIVIPTVLYRVLLMRYGESDVRSIMLLSAAIITVADIAMAFVHLHVLRFWILNLKASDVYENYYVDAKEADLVFPEKKRNLIYIFLESMESCYSSKGGGVTEYIPELTKLAMEGEDFSGAAPDTVKDSLSGESTEFIDSGEINGAFAPPGATFTTGAMVAHMAGISIDLQIRDKEEFLPGMTTIGDILAKEGYEQRFLLGSDVYFGGREPLIKQHGGYKVLDYKSAKRDGLIPEDYYLWWGFEDEKLFDFAKDELIELSKGDKPFNMTLLTVDTHFLDGCRCRLCRDEFKEPYGNVLACSSRQVEKFVEWIKQQDFYENTTIVLAGDHPTMDSRFIKRAGLRDKERKSYVSFINAPLTAQDKKREYTTLDLFPTTLSSLGVKIPGNRLGLGVDLFSGEETLYEKLGPEEFEKQFTRKSLFYRNFL